MKAKGWNGIEVSCDSCGDWIDSEHYHCIECGPGSVDFCINCLWGGDVCDIDFHGWVPRTLVDGVNGPRLVDIGDPISPGKATTIHTSYPNRFTPPNFAATPQSLFSNEHRFIRRSNPRQMLIYTDGACLSNGQANPRAGYSFVYRPSAYTQTGILIRAGTICQRLERRGPTGEPYTQTSNRAELRAVIAALQFKDWSTDCNGRWESLVIATDSEYVAVGVTQRIHIWEDNDWTTFNRFTNQWRDIKNQDLWILLLNLVRELQGEGVEVLFWRIRRVWNGRADEFAKRAAGYPEKQHFTVLQPASPVRTRVIRYWD
jgi:ribonuclease HI